MIGARALYRTRQVAKILSGRVTPSEVREACDALAPSLRPLFLSLSRGAKRHHLDVFQALHRAGHRDSDLLAAALLHDLGKGRVPLVVRVGHVILAAIDRRLPGRIAGSGGFGRGALWRIAHHPDLGADRIGAAGGSDRLVWLVRHHQDHGIDDPALRALQEADDGA